MKKMNCDIIQDLIPSYVDEICSDASKECVEEHLKDCDACRRIADLCKKTALSATSIEKKQLAGLKKWTHKIKQQNLYSYLLLLFIVGFGLYTFIGNPELSIRGYYVLFAVCLAGTYLFTTRMGKLQPMPKTDWFMTIGAAFLNILCLLTMYLCLAGAQGQSPFGLAPNKTGPFISNFLLICFMIQLCLTVVLLMHLFRKSLNTRLGLCVTLTGSFLALAYRTLLNDMNTLEHFHNNVIEITLIILVIGILGALLMKLISGRIH
ncbi:MAG: zf-HC2 domain-containing protein [Lachnospiraceae bacterium]|nr:zf-HC2 domain-containing protein [Lachnospiraceae bacterium]